MSAYGVGSGTGGGGGGLIATVYGSTDFGGTFNDANYNDTFNAYSINEIYKKGYSNTNRILNLESGTYNKNETDARIAAVVNSAPSTLDTLNELANALGNDPNFATTTANLIGTKLSLSGGQLTGQLGLLQGAGGGISFPDNSFGGGGDSASIKLLNPAGGESTEMTFTMTDDVDDIINFNVPSIDGVKINRYTVWNAGNFTNLNQLTTRNFNDLQNKPTTLGGYGITDSLLKSDINIQVGGTKNSQMLWSSWNNSDAYGGAIQIREYGYVDNTQSDWYYSPAISFHWRNRYVKRFGMRYDGQFAIDDNPILWSGNYSSYALPLSGGTLTGNLTAPNYLRSDGATIWHSGNFTNLNQLTTRSFSDLQNKPTTLSGYGITDVYTKTQTDGFLSLKLDKTTFNDLFEKVNIGTTASPVYAIKAKYNFYSVGEVSAFGAGAGSGGSGLIQTVYDYSGLGGTYNNATLTDTFNAYTINKINNDLGARITLLENGSALNFATIGTGNAITSVTKAGTSVTVTKGLTFSVNGHTHSYLPLSGGQLTGQLSLLQGAGGGIIFPNDSFGGGGDSASIKLLNPAGGESTEMTFTMTNDADDIINFSVPSIDGVKINRYTVWNAGNFTNLNQLTTRNFSDIQNKPTTIDGYQITDGVKNNGGLWNISIKGRDNTVGNALLQSGSGRSDDESGSTWLFWDTGGGSVNPWGIRHNQAGNYIEYYGNGLLKTRIDLNNGYIYTNGKANTGDQDLSNLSTYSYVDNTFSKKSDINIQVGGTKNSQMLWSSWNNSDGYGGAIQIREYGYVGDTQSDWYYSPAISFHWSNRNIIRLGMRYDGQLAIDNNIIWHSGNDGSGSGLDADLWRGYTPENINVASATKLSTNRTNWFDTGVIENVVGQLAWRNYGNNHTIFDASNGRTPNGTVCNTENAAVEWVSSYPTLMGYNGSETYGVRVDSSRMADKLRTGRYIFGQYFNGTGDVNGDCVINRNGVDTGIKINNDSDIYSTIRFNDTSGNFATIHAFSDVGYLYNGEKSINIDTAAISLGHWNEPVLYVQTGSKRVGINTTSPQSALDIASGSLTLRSFANRDDNTGEGFEIGYSNGGVLQSFDRTEFVYKPINYNASQHIFNIGNVLIGTATDSGHKLNVAGNVFFGGTLGTTSTLSVKGTTAFDSLARLNITNGSADYGRAQLRITGRLQASNDAWSMNGRNTIIFGVNAKESSVGIGEDGVDKMAIQYHMVTNQLGIVSESSPDSPIASISQNGAATFNSLGIANTSPSSGKGLSLFNGATDGKPAFGLFFGGTSTFGTHGAVTDSWAAYFTIGDLTNRGWIFQRDGTNVASISATGVATFNGAVTGNRFYTGYDSGETNSISCSNWFRSNGTSGWVNETYGGGITMTDSTYVRIHNNKAFKVTSTASDSINTSGGFLANGEIRSNSNITAQGELTAYVASDKRLKKNIKPINNALDVINKLEPVNYNWNAKAKKLNENKTDQKDFGLIAQDVEGIIPEIVHNIHDDKYKAIDYIKLIPFLIKSVQEQQKQIEELKEQLQNN